MVNQHLVVMDRLVDIMSVYYNNMDKNQHFTLGSLLWKAPLWKNTKNRDYRDNIIGVLERTSKNYRMVLNDSNYNFEIYEVTQHSISLKTEVTFQYDRSGDIVCFKFEGPMVNNYSQNLKSSATIYFAEYDYDETLEWKWAKLHEYLNLPKLKY